MPDIDNRCIAQSLERIAALLEAQEASTYRVRAYEAAAQTVRGLDRQAADIVRDEGSEALEELPHIGERIAAAITELVATGRLVMLERLEGEAGSEALFASLPGIGPALAHRIHAELDIDTFEQLEMAAHDGRLQHVHGIGPRRARAIRELLASRLGRRGRARRTSGPAPSVELLLAIDAQYRAGVRDKSLPRIAPRRFNPTAERWLPILHVDRDGWHFTALFSNTARAHELGHTRDWVVIYYERDGGEGRATVVTEHHGTLAGQRVVRGREAECAGLVPAGA
jgi:hypothetical protein